MEVRAPAQEELSHPNPGNTPDDPGTTGTTLHHRRRSTVPQLHLAILIHSP